MARSVYINGAWLPESEAKISVFDRGFLFADAIYEVTAVVGGKLIDYAGHSARLARSLKELGLRLPVDAEAMLALHREMVVRNGLTEGLIYLQVSRGAAERDFTMQQDFTPTFVMFTQAKSILANPRVADGLSVITMPDLRWARRDIKTVQLLYPSMAKSEAARRGADDAWLVENGEVNEATSSTAHIVSNAGALVTRGLSHALLPGVTRASVLDLARSAGIPVEERAFTPEEAHQASEAFMTSASAFVIPVTRIDDRPVGSGRPGPVTLKLRELYIQDRLASAI